ncbi:TonB family C-terminal domain-containing protein [bacterium JGI 053]|nr:TonB family C-terminal domain-containing protein [bacterium JGI 053]
MTPRLASITRIALAAAALLVAGSSTARAQAERDGPDTQPVLLNRRDMPRLTTAAYPPALRQRRLAGAAEVHMKVLPDGTVDSTTIRVISATEALFGPAAVQVARQLRFRPATIEKTPVAVWVDFPIAFGRPASGTTTDVQRDGRIFRENLPPPRP